jgi:hypothetical protein
MRKRLGSKRGLGGDEFELLPSSNGGAPARDWSNLAAQKARVSWGKDRGGLGIFIGEVSWKRGNKIGRFWLDGIYTVRRRRAELTGRSHVLERD